MLSLPIVEVVESELVVESEVVVAWVLATVAEVVWSVVIVLAAVSVVVVSAFLEAALLLNSS